MSTYIYEVWHQACHQYHRVSPQPFTCEATGETFQVELPDESQPEPDSWVIYDDSGAIEGYVEMSADQVPLYAATLPAGWEMEWEEAGV